MALGLNTALAILFSEFAALVAPHQCEVVFLMRVGHLHLSHSDGTWTEYALAILFSEFKAQIQTDGKPLRSKGK